MSASAPAPSSSATVGGIQTGQAPGAAYTHSTNACLYRRIGCRDPSAANYSPDATHSSSDHACVPLASMCAHEGASNYGVLQGQSEQLDGHYYTNPLVTADSSLCTFLHSGCKNSSAMNYSENADIHDESHCVYANVSACADPNALNYSGPPQGPAAAPVASCDDE